MMNGPREETGDRAAGKIKDGLPCRVTELSITKSAPIIQGVCLGCHFMPIEYSDR
jgi:hypothetical protein